MKRFGLSLFVAFTLCLVSGPALASDLQKGIQWYKKHVEYVDVESATVDPAAFDTAIEYLSRAVEQPETEEEAGRYLLHTYYLKGTYGFRDSDRKQKIFAKGKKLGERLIEAYPENVDLHILYAANLGRWGEAYGIISAAREGVAGTIRAQGKRILELNSKAVDGAGYRVLAQVHYKAPYIPFVLNWPSTDKAIGYLEEALKIAPEVPSNNALYGRYQYNNGNKKVGIKHLHKASRMEPRNKPQFLLDDARYIKEAREFLAENVRK